MDQKSYTFETKVNWTGNKKASLSAPDLPDVSISTPPEFNGHPGFWTPEHLFVSSVNTCVMYTFLYMAETRGLKILGFESKAVGTLEAVDKRLMFSKIALSPRILTSPGTDTEKIKKTLEMAERKCLVSNSIRSSITMDMEVKYQE